MIAVVMAQLHPTGDINVNARVIRLAYSAIKD
jgi:hypothetical protein